MKSKKLINHKKKKEGIHLIEEAVKALKNSYAPYSRFKVGSALRTKSGRIFSGCNVENASYGGTVCAERVAIFNAVSSGETDFEAIAIAVEGSEPAPPCGLCLQVMAEFCDDLPVYLISTNNKKVVKTSLGKLLPERFKKSCLPQGTRFKVKG